MLLIRRSGSEPELAETCFFVGHFTALENLLIQFVAKRNAPNQLTYLIFRMSFNQASTNLIEKQLDHAISTVYNRSKDLKIALEGKIPAF